MDVVKTHEVYRLGLERPKAEFIKQFDENKYRFVNGCLFDGFDTAAKYVGANEDWELIRESVSWQEAIQAWIDGKDIHVEFGGKIYYSYKHPEDMSILEISKIELQGGKWFIED